MPDWRQCLLPTAAVVGVALLLVGVLGHGAVGDVWAQLLVLVPFALSFAIGAEAGRWPGLAAVALLALGLQATNHGFNPLAEMVTVGPWLAGRVVRARRELSRKIAQRNRQLVAEQERFAAESIRYERVRIAGELHDIVAHSLSVVVLQAGAGQRLVKAGDPSAAEVFGVIAEAGGHALDEMDQLVEVMATSRAPQPSAVADLLELRRMARASGLLIRQFDTPDRALSPPIATVAYRVVQESLTNAIKHAPGATIDVCVRGGDDDTVEIDVVSSDSAGGPSGLERSGGGYGLGGLSERVTACGGTFSSGPTDQHGWRVHALLPLRVPRP
jgi:signal transduction histidine kinase